MLVACVPMQWGYPLIRVIALARIGNATTRNYALNYAPHTTPKEHHMGIGVAILITLIFTFWVTHGIATMPGGGFTKEADQ